MSVQLEQLGGSEKSNSGEEFSVFEILTAVKPELTQFKETDLLMDDLDFNFIELEKIINQIEQRYGSNLGMTAMEMASYKVSDLIGKVAQTVTTQSSNSVQAISIDPELNCNTLTERYVVGWQDASYLCRSVHTTNYVKWGGKVRDAVMLGDSRREFLKDVMLSNIGGASHFAEVTNLGTYLTAWDNVRTKVWVSGVKDRALVGYIVEIYKEEENWLVPVAVYESDASLTRVDGQGKIVMRELSDNGFRNITSFIPKDNAKISSKLLQYAIKPEHLGEPLKVAPKRPEGGFFIQSYQFKPSFIHSNLIGNMYFQNHFNLQTVTLDFYIDRVAPELLNSDTFLKEGIRGELIHINTKVKYLREIMPFDKILIKARLEILYDKGAVFSFEYLRKELDGRVEKTAIGSCFGVWGKFENGRLVPIPWPKKLMDALSREEVLDGKEHSIFDASIQNSLKMAPNVEVGDKDKQQNSRAIGASYIKIFALRLEIIASKQLTSEFVGVFEKFKIELLNFIEVANDDHTARELMCIFKAKDVSAVQPLIEFVQTFNGVARVEFKAL